MFTYFERTITMTKNIDTNFNPKKLVKDETFQGVPLDKPVKCTELKNGSQVMAYASIKKGNLSLGPYQRPEGTSRIKKIRENFHPDFGVINVAEIEHDGQYYYTIPDGQHRAKAQPEDTCPCIITNSKPEAELFLLANDPTCSKSTNKDDRFWAHLYNKDRQHVWFHDFMQDEYGISLARNTEENFKGSKFTGGVSLYKRYEAIHKLESRKRTKKHPLLDYEIDEAARSKFKILTDVMFGVFGQESFYSDPIDSQKRATKTAHSELWIGMVKFLSSDEFSWRPADIAIQALQKCLYSKNGGGNRPRNQPVKTIEDYLDRGVRDYPDLRRPERLWMTILSTYRMGQKVS